MFNLRRLINSTLSIWQNRNKGHCMVNNNTHCLSSRSHYNCCRSRFNLMQNFSDILDNLFVLNESTFLITIQFSSIKIENQWNNNGLRSFYLQKHNADKTSSDSNSFKNFIRVNHSHQPLRKTKAVYRFIF